MLKACPISLNTLSYNGVIKILETIRDIKPIRECPTVQHVYVDTGLFYFIFIKNFLNISLILNYYLVGDPEFYKSKLLSALGPNFSIEGFTIEKKADATYKIVSAGIFFSIVFICLYFLNI